MFYDIKSLLNKNIRQAGLGKQVEAVNIVELFNQLAPALLGQKIARQARAIHIRNSILTIQCSSSLVMQELHYREYKIIKILNDKLGRDSVKKIRYTA